MIAELDACLQRLGVTDPTSAIVVDNQWTAGAGTSINTQTPIDGSNLGEIQMASPSQLEDVIATSQQGFFRWRAVPAPKIR